MISTAHDVTAPHGVTILGPMHEGYDQVLGPDALDFVADLTRRFRARVHELLAARRRRQAEYDSGESPDFLPDTRWVRTGDWTVAPLPGDLLDRRVEITGPVDPGSSTRA